MDLNNYKNSTVKSIRLTWKVLVFVLVFLIPPNLHSEDTGFKYLKNYSYREYDHQAQNWGMVQAKNGIIYVANQGGVLEFDGVSWRIIGIPDYAPVRSLVIDETGTIYIGGKGEIGYLARDANGTLTYNSLCGYLPDDQKRFSNVWGTYAIGKDIYFDTSTFLFRWDSKQRELQGVSRQYSASFICAGKLFIRREKAGLEQIVQVESHGLKTVPIPGGEEFAEKKIYMITPYSRKKLMIGTYENGLYIHDGRATMPFPTEVDDYLRKNKLYHGIRLSSGDFALATLQGGIVIINPAGRLKYIIDKSSGLQDDNIKYVFQDNQENLWLCLDRGISKIEYASPISIHNERSNLYGLVLSVVKHHHDLYVGTTNGLYYLESPLKFRLLPGISSSCWSLLSIQDSILVATSEGVFQVKKNIPQKVLKCLSFVLLPSKRYTGYTWCGTKNGLKVLIRKNNQWIEGHRFDAINQEIRTIVEDKNGHLWLFTSPGGVLEVDFSVNITHPLLTRYDTSHGLPAGQVYGAVAAGHVIFATGVGIFRFDEKNKVFIPDQTLGNKFAGGSHSRPVFRIVEDKNKNIWFHSQSRNYQTIPGPGNSFTIDPQPFRRIPTIQVNAIYPDPNGKTIWFASFEGVIRYDTTIKKNYRQDFPTLVRRVLVNEKLIFDGYKNKTGKASQGLFPIIKHKNRNLHFEFAAPFFEAETETMYRCFLEGYDGNWPPWSKDTKRNYTNLASGLYAFRVQARNVYQHLGSEDIFRFKVLPPWYKAWWAFLLYALGMVILIYGIVKWRSIKLEKEKQKLENIIKERTKEIKQKNEQLEKQTFQLKDQSKKLKEKSDQLEKQTLQLKDQSEKLKEMDKVKSRFFANISHEFRTPLTLIKSPLEQMLSGSRDKEQKKILNVMLRNSQRLLTLINQLLDLSRFDSGKMKLQAACQNIVPFLKSTLESFRMLALQNQLELGFHCEQPDIFIYFDTQKMEEVMYNLLINAIKFTPAGGKITVSVSPDQQDPGQPEVKISVRDTGIGIPKEQFDYIFDRFYQAEGLKEEAYKGAGIGLALTKEIILLHHGNIDVHSQEGEGTEFVIRLPIGNQHLKPGEMADSLQTPSNLKKNRVETRYMPSVEEYASEENKDFETKDSTEETKPGKQEKNVILVVEDHVDVRKHIRDSLESLYKIEEAGNGREGIEKAKKIIPDLIISDIMMPETDGCELCRVLKGELKTSHIPIILLTAKASEENIIEGLETKADDYITKPFNKKILMARIKNLIELRRQLQQKFQQQICLHPDEIEISSVDQEFIKELQDVIEKNLSDPKFHVEQLSEKLYMNRVTLFRKIKALTGETPTEYIRSYRLLRAAQLLKDNFGNVSEVAIEVGFSNLGYFTRCFKEKFQQLPSEYQAS
ncbi:MAG: response regulator [Candidatus Aminicenantes bacterium]|jgi:signal transduction histidine kinase/DNA-binding response OmpR family regulator